MARKSLTNLPPMPRFSTIGKAERINLDRAMKMPLSGYIGGATAGGYWVEKLNVEWAEAFNVGCAIACNSATSGLWAAVVAAEIVPGDVVWVSSYTMSATAACLASTGAVVRFIDIESHTFNMDTNLFLDLLKQGTPKAIIVTNLFGHPASVEYIRSFCDRIGAIMIEDNAQAPFAQEKGVYTGTVGHMGVFSLNVHKHMQCGEGGVIVTNNTDLATRCRLAINHGELSSNRIIGLNLRMTEPIAAIACAQLKKGPKIIQNRIDIAEYISDLFEDNPFVIPPAEEVSCRHVYYMWAGSLRGQRPDRFKFVAALQGRGIPVRLGYSRPLNQIFQSVDDCEIAGNVDREGLMTFEICAYDPKTAHLKKMGAIIEEETERLLGDSRARPDTNTDAGRPAA